MKIESLLNKFKIQKGDKIILTSDIMGLLIQFRKKKKTFNPNTLIDLLKKKIGKNGTLLIPTFNWDFCKGKTFHYNKSLSQSGSLGNIALKRKDFLRSFNPIYSFAVTGKDKSKICNIKHTNCFSLNSPFGYLIKNKGKNLFIGLKQKTPKGTSKLYGFVFHHVVEQYAKVRYRYIKEFHGYYVDKSQIKKKIVIKFFVRDLKKKYQVYLNDRFDYKAKKNKILKNFMYKNINCQEIDLKRTFKILVDDLKNKRNLFVKQY